MGLITEAAALCQLANTKVGQPFDMENQLILLLCVCICTTLPTLQHYSSAVSGALADICHLLDESPYLVIIKRLGCYRSCL